MNLSELIHRPSEDTQPVVTSTYDSFQRTTTDAMHLDSIYNESEIIDSRFAESNRGVSDASLYSSTKLLPLTTSWHYTAESGGDRGGGGAAASRSPNASTLSDQSASTDSFRPKRVAHGDSPSFEGAHSSVSSNRTLVENSPASPAPLDSFVAAEVKSTTGLYQKRRTSITLSVNESIGSSYNNSSGNRFSPESIATGRSGEMSAAPEPQTIAPYQNHQQLNSSSSNTHSSANEKATMGSPATELTIRGDNVTKETLEEGYIQFVLHHDPMYIGDSIENHMYMRRKFSSVPKTGDLSYTTWDVYTLVKKLHNHQIKNWSQLVGQLGLSDVPGRPQFAQRVKRWMRKYRIDSYFDYLLGNPYKFHTAPGEKYSGCLIMGNYQKRKANSIEADVRSADDEAATTGSHANSTINNKRRRRHYDMSHDDEEEEEEEDFDNTDEDHGGAGTVRRTPIVHAGSRKRRSQMPAAMILREEEDNEDLDAHNPSTPPDIQAEDVSMYPREYLREDEEDELASTSSSISLSSYMSDTTTTNTQPEQQLQQSSTIAVTNPASSPKPINLPTSNTTTPAETTAGPSSDAPNSPSTPIRPPLLLLSASLPSPQHHSSPVHAPSLPSNLSCNNCGRLQDTVNSLKDDVMQLKHQLLTLEERLRQEIESKTKVSMRLESLCDHYEKWRTRLAEQLLENPFSDDKYQA